MLKEVLQNSKVDEQVSLFLVAVVEYISADILKVRSKKKKAAKQYHVTPLTLLSSWQATM